MSNDTIHVGPKNRHARIPNGWYRVTDGICKKDDMYADTSTGIFMHVEEEDIGLPVSLDDDSCFDCLIRKQTFEDFIKK